MEKYISAALLLLVGACGDDGGGGGADAGGDGGQGGFDTPEETTTAYEPSGDEWSQVGPADWSCLGTPSDVEPTTVAVTVDGTVVDFLSEEGIEGATVTAYPGIDVTGTPLAEDTSIADGAFEVEVPSGTERVAYGVTADRYFDTYLVNQSYEPDVAEQEQQVRAISEGLAEALPATINKILEPGTGVLAGAIRDCQGHEVKGAIATVSSVSGSPEHLEGAETFYFSAASQSLPVLHEVAPATNEDGLFVVFDIPVTTEAYIQVWGFTSDQDPAADELTLLAEIPAPVLPDALISASMEPLRSE